MVGAVALAYQGLVHPAAMVALLEVVPAVRSRQLTPSLRATVGEVRRSLRCLQLFTWNCKVEGVGQRREDAVRVMGPATGTTGARSGGSTTTKPQSIWSWRPNHTKKSPNALAPMTTLPLRPTAKQRMST